jgi:hypothetical protein
MAGWHLKWLSHPDAHPYFNLNEDARTSRRNWADPEPTPELNSRCACCPWQVVGCWKCSRSWRFSGGGPFDILTLIDVTITVLSAVRYGWFSLVFIGLVGLVSFVHSFVRFFYPGTSLFTGYNRLQHFANSIIWSFSCLLRTRSLYLVKSYK